MNLKRRRSCRSATQGWELGVGRVTWLGLGVRSESEQVVARCCVFEADKNAEQSQQRLVCSNVFKPVVDVAVGSRGVGEARLVID